ncbi:AlpA family phage regulatory protein [Actinoplanes sp. NPDC023936]|uniref:helix-turn-helix transcriptional regulator n=1 Tax=Actinoplanes sp. NPDC023936 TaxID=3154910 RepID=UPI0033D5F6E7
MTVELERLIAAALTAHTSTDGQPHGTGGPVIHLSVAQIATIAVEVIKGHGKQRLMGAAEVRARLGVSRQRVYQLINRPDFPEPYAVMVAGRFWEESAVEAWIQVHRPTRSPDQPIGSQNGCRRLVANGE